MYVASLTCSDSSSIDASLLLINIFPSLTSSIKAPFPPSPVHSLQKPDIFLLFKSSISENVPTESNQLIFLPEISAIVSGTGKPSDFAY